MEQLLESLGITVLKKYDKSFNVESSIPDREQFLEELAKGLNGSYVRKRFSSSSIGRVEVEGYYIYAKKRSGDRTRYEAEVVNQFNGFISCIKRPLNIKIPNLGIFKDISQAIQVNTTLKRSGGVNTDPKADVILVREGCNPLDPQNIFISHKKDGGATAFQQYAGISKAAGQFIHNHTEVQNFLRGVVPRISSERLECALMSEIKCETLIKKAIYGPDWGESNYYSLQNCTVLAQGKIQQLNEVSKNTFQLEFSGGMHNNGDISIFKNSGYEAVLAATYRTDRGFYLEGNRYNGARVGIYPKAWIERRIKEDHQIIK